MKRSNEVDIGLVLLINVAALVKRFYLWEPESILQQSQSLHCPLLLRNDYIRAKVEALNDYPTSSPFSPEFWTITSLIILQQDSFHLKKPLCQTEGKHTLQGSQWLFHGGKILNCYFFFIFSRNFRSFHNETAWMLYVEEDAVYLSDLYIHIYIFNTFILFIIIFWLCWVLVAASRGYSSLRCAVFSLRWLLLLRSMGSRPAGFSSCGARAQ